MLGPSRRNSVAPGDEDSKSKTPSNKKLLGAVLLGASSY